jgi:hypothetical protein
MRRALQVFGVLLVLNGLVWILQGANILLGSFMSGQPQWILWGTVSAGIGAGLIGWGKR